MRSESHDCKRLPNGLCISPIQSPPPHLALFNVTGEHDHEVQFLPPQEPDYLKVPPDVIDVSIGRTLFVDNFVVESMSGSLAISHHQATHVCQSNVPRHSMNSSSSSSSSTHKPHDPNALAEFSGFSFWPGFLEYDGGLGLFRIFFTQQTYGEDPRYKRCEWHRPLHDFQALSHDGRSWFNVTKLRGVPPGDAATILYDRRQQRHWMVKAIAKGTTTMRFSWALEHSDRDVRGHASSSLAHRAHRTRAHWMRC